MAGQAEKKRMKSAEEYGFYYFWIIVAASTIFFSYRVLWRFSSLSTWHIVGILAMYGIYYFSYSSIKDSLQIGVPYEYSQDIYIINVIAQLSTTFTDFGWYLYLSLPAFAIYKAGKLIIDWVFTSPPDMSTDPAYIKKQEKLERKMKQGRVKMVRS
eukprot:GHVS01045342.1.p1 GENE.GHVS01045342.1~~GHVS01045342.1.p1  ORF type:complete len:156 (+),score=10.70 GHVS01045342.1:206-673(+)